MENFDNYKSMADGVAALMHSHAEVVIHDLQRQEIVYLANNYSNREIGSPSHMDEVEFADGDRVLGPYRKVNWDGKILKSISVVMRNNIGQAEAMICINLDMSDMNRMYQVLGMMLAAPEEGHEPEENSGEKSDKIAEIFRDDWHERINVFIQEWLQGKGLSLQVLGRSEKRNLVIALEAKGAFQGQGSANYVARCLGLGRATVYKYLKEQRGSA
ncbi:transcriptional regulator [Kiloniella sp. EL199]|uniref:helix-turn-helix transcriptional regulator n=1 Tax=Kiloniella sp. EL199 TaxID=2107581 RepID=UPI000EA068D5|nr:PAS domain-containing protein [Kiloniella sp. EL199]